MGSGPTQNQHICVGCLVVTSRAEVREGPGIRCSSSIRRFGSDVLWSDVRSGSDVQGVGRPVVFRKPAFWLGFGSVGRQEGVGRPVPGVRRAPEVRRSSGDWEFRAVLLLVH